jgi:quercetin dioxygenase-like cupin family protein
MTSEGHQYTREHQISGEELTFDLNKEGETLLSEARSAPAGRAGRTLVKDGPMRLVLMALKGGSVIDEHKADGALSIQVLRGNVNVGVGTRERQLSETQTLVLEPNVRHSLLAREESLVLLTIAMAA